MQMPAPVNYSINAVNPADSFMEGIQLNQQRNTQQQQQAMAMRQAEASQQQQMAMQQDLGALAAKENPTVQDYIRISTRYPELSKQFKDMMGTLSEDQKQNKINSVAQVVSALHSGDTETASNILMGQAAALRNSGKEAEAAASESLAKVAKMDPKSALRSASVLLSSAMGAENFAKSFDSLFKTPAQTETLEAEAANAGTKIGLENQLSVEKIQDSQLKRKLDVIDGRLRQETNDLKREELQAARDKLTSEATIKQEERGTAAQNRLDTVVNARKSLTELMQSPLLKGGTASKWAGPGSFWYSVSKNVPFTATLAKDLEASIAKTQAKEFLQALDAMKAGGPSGLGSLTEKEGEALRVSRANLDSAQSYEQFMKEANTLAGLMDTSIARARQQSGLPTTNTGVGASVVVKSSPYGQVTEAMVNTALKNNPGATRDQVIQFLQSQSTGAR